MIQLAIRNQINLEINLRLWVFALLQGYRVTRSYLTINQNMVICGWNKLYDVTNSHSYKIIFSWKYIFYYYVTKNCLHTHIMKLLFYFLEKIFYLNYQKCTIFTSRSWILHLKNKRVEVCLVYFVFAKLLSVLYENLHFNNANGNSCERKQDGDSEWTCIVSNMRMVVCIH